MSAGPDRAFDDAIAEYGALRKEVLDTSRNQFQLTALADVAAVVGAVAARQYTSAHLWLPALTGVLALVYVLIWFELNVRLRGLGRRLEGLEREIGQLTNRQGTARWQTSYVPALFGGSASSLPHGRCPGILGRLAEAVVAGLLLLPRSAPIMPLYVAYAACLAVVNRAGVWYWGIVAGGAVFAVGLLRQSSADAAIAELAVNRSQRHIGGHGR